MVPLSSSSGEQWSKAGAAIVPVYVQGDWARRGRLLGENLSKVTAEQMTAVRATIRVVGPDVDPFNPAKQASARAIGN